MKNWRVVTKFAFWISVCVTALFVICTFATSGEAYKSTSAVADAQIAFDSSVQRVQNLTTQYASIKQLNDQQSASCSQNQGKLIDWLLCMPDLAEEQSIQAELQSVKTSAASLQSQIQHLEHISDSSRNIFVSTLVFGFIATVLSWSLFGISVKRRPKPII